MDIQDFQVHSQENPPLTVLLPMTTAHTHTAIQVKQNGEEKYQLTEV